MDEQAKTLGETTSEEHDCVRELWWAATGCYFSEDSLDKAEKASIAFLESRNLRVHDPARCLVLERRESVPEESGRYLVVSRNKSDGSMSVWSEDQSQIARLREMASPETREKFDIGMFGPIKLPATEGR